MASRPLLVARASFVRFSKTPVFKPAARSSTLAMGMWQIAHSFSMAAPAAG